MLTWELGIRYISSGMDKKIVVDCDGVLLDWAYAFDVWMAEQGFHRVPDTQKYYSQSKRYGISELQAIRQIQRFNDSGCVGFIPAYKDAVEYVNKLYNLGWSFEVVSSLNKDKYAQSLREKNLIHLFGNVFDFIDCSLDHTYTKEEYLRERYSGKEHFWIEDSVSNAIAGRNIGLHSVIMDHEHNQEWDGPRVMNWKDVYQMMPNDDTTH